jgi:co-chaperonin GroES (HSP10)
MMPNGINQNKKDRGGAVAVGRRDKGKDAKMQVSDGAIIPVKN